MSELFTRFLIDFRAEQITEFFIILIIVIAVTTVVLAYKGISEAFVRYSPSLLTSLGILGTFTGIVIGLYHFDPTKIDESIPLLLNGLKTAFMTSLVGIGSALIVKVILTHPFKQADTNTGIEDVGASDLLQAINSQSEHLANLHAAIAGDETSSLTGQIKLLRSDSNENAKTLITEQRNSLKALSKIESLSNEQKESFNRFSEKLWLQMQDFADMLSRSATETVIEALKEVISDFNKNLTEQFGENFKELNSAVLKLVAWQEDYRIQLEQMAAQYAQGVEAITKTEVSVEHISRESEKIPATMSDLKTIIEVNQHQLNELSNHLDAFKAVRDKAVEAVPEIHAQIDKTVTDLNSAVEGASEHYKVMLDKSSDYLNSHNDRSADLLEKLTVTSEQGLDRLKEGFEKGADDVASGLSDGADAFRKAIKEEATEFKNTAFSVHGSLQSTSDQLVANSEKIGQSLTESSDDIQSKLSDMLVKIDERSKSIIVSFEETGKGLLEQNSVVLQQTTEGIEDMRKQLQSSIEHTLGQQAGVTETVVQGMAEQMTTSLQRTEDHINKQLSAMDEALEKELGQVLSVMGQNLTSITQKFTSDYKVLTDSMHQVVGESRRFDS
jgi:chromosome segregation ATPase